jgi:hypothetical protein
MTHTYTGKWRMGSVLAGHISVTPIQSHIASWDTMLNLEWIRILQCNQRHGMVLTQMLSKDIRDNISYLRYLQNGLDSILEGKATESNSRKNSGLQNRMTFYDFHI